MSQWEVIPLGGSSWTNVSKALNVISIARGPTTRAPFQWEITSSILVEVLGFRIKLVWPRGVVPSGGPTLIFREK